MSSPQTDRLHGLDAVRGIALLLGLFFHAALSFLPGDQLWIAIDTERSHLVSGLSFTLHMFRMTVFFLIAGYFGRLMIHRRGWAGFTADRLKRIGVPMVVFWPILIVLFTTLAIWSMIVANGGTMPENPPPPPPLTLQTFPLTHLWFLYFLLLCYAGALALRAVLSLTRTKTLLGRVSDAILGKFAPLPLFPLLMAVPTAIALYYHPMWFAAFGIPTPEYGFVPNRAASIAYGGAFALGWLLQRQSDFITRLTKLWPLYLVIAAGLTAYCLSVVSTTISFAFFFEGQEKLFYVSAYAAAIWFWTFGFIGLCLKLFATENRVVRYIADSSYWLYLIHLPLIMALQIWVSQWTWPAEAKYAFIVGLSFPLLLASYHLVVRRSFIGSILNGKKHPKTNQIPEEQAI
jgi:peptidoglycan/LPS O-acetylase OafA/YrhL